MTKKFPGEIILRLKPDTACKLSGYKPSSESTLIVHNVITEVTSTEAKEGNTLTVSHIPSGLSLTPVIPPNLKTQSQLLLFARWLDEAAKEELNVLKALTIEQRQHTPESYAATQALKEAIKNYQKGN